MGGSWRKFYKFIIEPSQVSAGGLAIDLRGFHGLPNGLGPVLIDISVLSLFCRHVGVESILGDS